MNRSYSIVSLVLLVVFCFVAVAPLNAAAQDRPDSNAETHEKKAVSIQPGIMDASKEAPKGVPLRDNNDDRQEPKPAILLDAGLSAFEEHARGDGMDITQFGYNLFAAPPTTFAPVEAVPVSPDYLLGPNDELNISIWGKLNSDYTVRIDREGKITLPQMGVLHITGLTFSEAKALLEEELARYYKPSEVKMNVSMGALRSIKVFVVGKAKRPGSYTVSSLSTLVNALFASGGPAKIGSMRDIQVKRGGKTVVSFDLYDFLLMGDKSKDVKLQSEDVIFIPPTGPLAGIAGYVRYPAIYELKGPTSLNGLIEMAGGLEDIAFKGRVQISRIVNNNRQTVYEASLDETDAAGLNIEPGDLVRIFPIVSEKRFVRLSGAVQRDGMFGIGTSMKVKDLISLAGGLKFYAYKKQAEITRVVATQEGPSTTKIVIDLEKALSGDEAHNITLKADDYLFIRSIPEWDLYKTVTIKGEVRFPGTYTITKGETISGLIERAGGFTGKAYLKGAVFTRESVRELQQRQLDEAIDRLERELLSQSVEAIESALDPESAKQVQASAAQKKSLIAKMRSAKAKGRISIQLTRLENFKGSPSDLALDEGDNILIPDVESHVQVIGSVYNQTAYVYDRDASVANYIKKSGGLTKNADEDEIYVLKVDGTAVSKRSSSVFGVRWDSDDNRWVGGSFMSSRLDPGDTIVVPENVEQVFWVKEVKDITQILYQIAVTAGVLIVAF